MTVEAIAAVTWKKDADDNNVPDELDNVIQHTTGNKWEDITGQDGQLIPGKITGNLKNLAAFKLVIADTTWAAFDNSNKIEWLWHHQTTEDQDGNVTVVDSNRDDTLPQNQFNALVSWLTSNGFDPSSLVNTDTRKELTNKLLVIFKQ